MVGPANTGRIHAFAAARTNERVPHGNRHAEARAYITRGCTSSVVGSRQAVGGRIRSAMLDAPMGLGRGAPEILAQPDALDDRVERSERQRQDGANDAADFGADRERDDDGQIRKFQTIPIHPRADVVILDDVFRDVNAGDDERYGRGFRERQQDRGDRRAEKADNRNEVEETREHGQEKCRRHPEQLERDEHDDPGEHRGGCVADRIAEDGFPRFARGQMDAAPVAGGA